MFAALRSSIKGRLRSKRLVDKPHGTSERPLPRDLFEEISKVTIPISAVVGSVYMSHTFQEEESDLRRKLIAAGAGALVGGATGLLVGFVAPVAVVTLPVAIPVVAWSSYQKRKRGE